MSDCIKRGFDIGISLFGLIFLLPFMVLIGFSIWLRGKQIFFRQERVGLEGRIFKIVKFRSMSAERNHESPLITIKNDARITNLGRFLRRSKLDELPQLYNVLMGEMSIVGPRPEVPKYVGLWPKEDRRIVLSVRPGMTDFASLRLFDEESYMARFKDPEEAYIREILPFKLGLYRDYVRNRNLGLDIQIFLATLTKSIRTLAKI